jgi:alpha-L-arabinofuranosidase
LRIDLMQKLADLHPPIFRVPGGNYLEGNTFADRFNWSATIGPVENRPGHYNSAWGYWSTDGMGLDEYLQMAEEVGAQPILAVYAGYTLNGTSDTGATLTNDVNDAVNELHYVLDPTSTSWGAMRAANGHPAPYNVNYVEIGNEDFFSSTYPTRYPLFYNSIHTAFPSLKIIATSSSTGGSPFDVLDDHFYNSPSWFIANSNHYDNVARGSYKIFVGEYAAREGAPTNDMAAALGDAAWLLGLERNSDLVTMSSYAPLWANVNGVQWTPDLIGFNNTSSYGSPSYYGQVMLSQNHGTTVVSSSVTGAGGLQTLVTRTGTTYYLTVINTLASANVATVNLSGVSLVSPTAAATMLSASSSTATNSITDPTNIVPVTSGVSGLGTSFTQAFPAYSITILQFTANVGAPNTPTNSSPTNGATNVSLTPTLNAGAFSDPDPSDSQGASQWIVVRTSDSSTVFDSGTDTVHLTSLTLPAGSLAGTTGYTWKVRYQDHDGNWSNYSTSTSFTTAAVPAPQPVSSSFAFDEPGGMKIRVQFSANVGASIDINDLNLQTVPSGPVFHAASVSYDSGTNTATFILPLSLPDANYVATLNASGITDGQQTLSGNILLNFFVLGGDANRDRKVDATDLGILSLNWNQTGRAFSQGNFDYSADGLVNVNDLDILAAHWQQALAAPVLSPAPPHIRSPVRRAIDAIEPAPTPMWG